MTSAMIEAVTPQLASKWLERNTSNRTLAHLRVKRLAEDMNSGKWIQTGESIKLSKTGRLLDGQHRLAAVVESGATVEMMVVRDLDDSAQYVVDTGRPRSSSDGLMMVGVANARHVSSCVRSIAIITAPSRGAPKLNTADALRVLNAWGPERVQRQVSQIMQAPRGVRVAAVTATGVLVDAAFGLDAGAEFAACMNLGDGPPNLQLLRESLLRSSGGMGQVFFFRTAERCAAAVRNWRDGATRTQIKGGPESIRWLVENAVAGLNTERK